MLTIESYTLMRNRPSAADMSDMLIGLDRGACHAFLYGSYRQVFSGLRHTSDPPTADNWAKAYIKNQEALEYGAHHAYSVHETNKEVLAHTALSIAARRGRRTRAGIAIDIPPVFENFTAHYLAGWIPRNARLATTRKQVDFLLAVAAATGGGFFRGEALSSAATTTDYIISAIASALPDGRKAEAQRYHTAVRRWLGRSRNASLAAVQLAAAGVTAEDIILFSQHGIESEYALSLTEAASSR